MLPSKCRTRKSRRYARRWQMRATPFARAISSVDVHHWYESWPVRAILADEVEATAAIMAVAVAAATPSDHLCSSSILIPPSRDSTDCAIDGICVY